MCRILGVKRSNYYKWLHHKKSIVDKENEEIAELIKEYHKKYNGLLGYRMLAVIPYKYTYIQIFRSEKTREYPVSLERIILVRS